MSCGCCCTKTLDLCKVDICSGQLDLDLFAQSEGNHTLVTFFMAVRMVITGYFTAGQRMIFDVSNLNENFQFTAEAYDPTGIKIVIRKSGVDYDCFKFQTALTKNFN